MQFKGDVQDFAEENSILAGGICFVRVVSGGYAPLRCMTFDRREVSRQLAELAARGIFIGTSSWKYPGWRGILYDDQRYIYRGRFAESRFEKYCLAEYAEVFKTVCVDAAYYKYPEQRFLDALAAQVPDDFLFSFKVTDEITVKNFPNLDRFGARAGSRNEHFLNPERFASEFLGRCEAILARIGVLIFEFSKFHRSDYAQGRDFVADLDRFLGRLPRCARYAVEIRNRHFLQPDYFAMLRRHGVAHVFNSWTEMPPVHEQAALAGARTCEDLGVARLLVKPGSSYDQTVRTFQPYNQLKEPYEECRAAIRELIRSALREVLAGRLLIYVNNRLEGNALATIAAILAELKPEAIGSPVGDPGGNSSP